MGDRHPIPLTTEELEAELAAPLPAKEVVSLLDLDVNLDLALDLAAPIDLAIAANANVAAPIEAAVSANTLSFGSNAPQTVDLDQSDDTVGRHRPSRRRPRRPTNPRRLRIRGSPTR